LGLFHTGPSSNGLVGPPVNEGLDSKIGQHRTIPSIVVLAAPGKAQPRHTRAPRKDRVGAHHLDFGRCSVRLPHGKNHLLRKSNEGLCGQIPNIALRAIASLYIELVPLVWNRDQKEVRGPTLYHVSRVCFLCRTYGKGDGFSTTSRVFTADGREGSGSGDSR
jgi:hypothetical protein